MNLADVISEQAAARPGAPAVVEPDRILSYAQLDAAVWRAAAWFASNGIRPGDVVGVTLPGNLLHLVAAFAMARMGAIQLPLPERESAHYRAALAERFRARAVLGNGDTARLPGLDFLIPPLSWLHDGKAPAAADLRCAGGEAPWKIVLTSGTTGTPRAVLQTHAMHIIWRGICQAGIPLRPEDRYLAVIGLDFVAGFLRCANVLHAGGAVLVGFSMPRPSELLNTLERQAVSYAWLTPPHLHQLLAFLGDHRERLRGLRLLRVGSMVVGEKLRQEIRARLTPNLLVSYGSNDGGTPFTVAQGETFDRHPGSLGFPPPGVELSIVDEEDRPLTPGEIGNVRVRAAGMPAAYLDDPEASARAFRGGWFYPGDLGFLSPEGALHFMGRSDERMNFDGIKLYPVEIEAALLEHPAIAEAAAFALPSEAHQDIPVAAVVLRAEVDQAGMLAWIQERLGVRAPRRLLKMKELPRNARGKVLKKKLVEIAAAKFNPA